MKRQPKQTRLAQLDAQMQDLQRKRGQAYTAGMSQAIVEQLERMIDEVSLEMYTESELVKHRAEDKGDGEDYIV